MRKNIQKLNSRFSRFGRVLLPRRIKRMKIISRHPLAVPVITFSFLILVSLGVFLFVRHSNHLTVARDYKVVIVSHDHLQQVVPSSDKTVGALLVKLKITLNEGDVVEPAISAPINQDDFRINIYRAVPVVIVDGASKTFTFSAATTPRSIASQADQIVYPEDVVTTTPSDDFLSSGAIGEQVIIDRATPLNVDLYGTPVVLRTHATTVRELMKEKHIKLAKTDQVIPAPDTPLSTNQQISFLRTGTKAVTVTEDVPAPVQTINDASLAYGTTAVRQQGAPGQQITTYQVTLENNVETGRTVIQQVVTKQPVTQITVVGSSLSGIKGDMALAGIAPGDYEYVDYIVSHESGWCPTKPQGAYGGCPAYAGSVPDYGGYGLCQSTPGNKMASAGADWATNPVTQLRWCAGYAQGRYGSWYAAYSYWTSHHNW